METLRKVTVWKLKFLAIWWPLLVFMWCVFWFVFLFTPLEQGDAYVKKISPSKIAYYNISRKPFPSELICQIESSVAILNSNVGQHIETNRREANWGTGSRDWSTWRVEVQVPFGASLLEVHKELTYRCLGVFFKKSRTASRIINMED